MGKKTFNDTGMGRIIAWISARVFKKSEAVTTQTLGIDSAPSNNSSNLVTSGGVYNALSGKVNTSDLATVATSGDYDDLTNKPTIPSAPGTLVTNATAAQTVSSGEAMSGSITLHKISKTGTYSDLIGTPTIPSAPGTLNTTATTAQSTSSSEALSGNVTLHKVSKTGSYNDLLNKPTIPSAPGTLNTTATTAQSTNASEALSGSVTLHKVSKTGSYSDLIGKPAKLSDLTDDVVSGNYLPIFSSTDQTAPGNCTGLSRSGHSIVANLDGEFDPEIKITGNADVARLSTDGIDFHSKTYTVGSGYNYNTSYGYSGIGYKPSGASTTYSLSFPSNSGTIALTSDITGKEDVVNKVTNITPTSTDTQYPSAKCMYDRLSTPFIASKEQEGFASSSTYSVHCLLTFKPTDWNKMYTIRFKIHGWVESETDVESVSDITLQCFQGVVKAYYIQNAIADTSKLAYYNLYYYGITASGYTAGAEAIVGPYVNSANCWSYTTKRKFRVDLIWTDGCTATLLNDCTSTDAKTGFAASCYVDSVKYNTYTAGLQETGDSNTTYSVISNDELRTGTATTGRTVSAARLKANYNISTDSTTGVKTLRIADQTMTPEDITNKVTSLSSSSTDTQYPSAKCVYDAISETEEVTAAALNDLNDRLENIDISTDGQKSIIGEIHEDYPDAHQNTYLSAYPAPEGSILYFGDREYREGESYEYENLDTSFWPSSTCNFIVWEGAPNADCRIMFFESGTYYFYDNEPWNIDSTWGYNSYTDYHPITITSVDLTYGDEYYEGYTDGTYTTRSFTSSWDGHIYLYYSGNTAPNVKIAYFGDEYRMYKGKWELYHFPRSGPIGPDGYDDGYSRYSVYDFTTGSDVWNAIHPEVEAYTYSGNRILPNRMYRLGTITGSKTFVLADAAFMTSGSYGPYSSSVVNHYFWTFETGSTAPTITWPSGLTWPGGSPPAILANKHYEISVLNNYVAWMEV